MAVELEHISPSVWAGKPVEALHEALDLLDNCGRTLRETLASVAVLDDNDKQLVLSTLPPGSEALLRAADVIVVMAHDKTWLTAFGEFVVELAHAHAEAKDPGGKQRSHAADASRSRVLDRVAAAKAACKLPATSGATLYSAKQAQPTRRALKDH